MRNCATERSVLSALLSAGRLSFCPTDAKQHPGLQQQKPLLAQGVIREQGGPSRGGAGAARGRAGRPPCRGLGLAPRAEAGGARGRRGSRFSAAPPAPPRLGVGSSRPPGAVRGGRRRPLGGAVPCGGGRRLRGRAALAPGGGSAVARGSSRR